MVWEERSDFFLREPSEDFATITAPGISTPQVTKRRRAAVEPSARLGFLSDGNWGTGGGQGLSSSPGEEVSHQPRNPTEKH